MFDILSAILYDEPMDLRGKGTFKDPCTIAENRVLSRLRTLDGETADALKQDVCTLVQEQREQVFLTGVRFGGQLTLQLLDDY